MGGFPRAAASVAVGGLLQLGALRVAWQKCFDGNVWRDCLSNYCHLFDRYGYRFVKHEENKQRSETHEVKSQLIFSFVILHSSRWLPPRSSTQVHRQFRLEKAVNPSFGGARHRIIIARKYIVLGHKRKMSFRLGSEGCLYLQLDFFNQHDAREAHPNTLHSPSYQSSLIFTVHVVMHLYPSKVGNSGSLYGLTQS